MRIQAPKRGSRLIKSSAREKRHYSTELETRLQLRLARVPAVDEPFPSRVPKLVNTRINSSNLASDMLGGPTHDVDWSTSDLARADLNHVKIDAPAATISVVALGGGG
jgi:hypothetical protein